MDPCVAVSPALVACILAIVWMIAIGGTVSSVKIYTRLGMTEHYSPIGIFMWIVVALVVTWIALQADPNGATSCTSITTFP